MKEIYRPFTRKIKKFNNETAEKIFSALVMRRCSRSFQDAGDKSFDKVNDDSILLNPYGRRTVRTACPSFCVFDGGTGVAFPTHYTRDWISYE